MIGCPRDLPVCVFTSHRGTSVPTSQRKEWLLIEWPEDEDKPTRYWLSTLPKNITVRRSGRRRPKLRWRIERDYQELKQEVGLGHFEGADGAASTITPRCASRPTDS